MLYLLGTSRQPESSQRHVSNKPSSIHSGVISTCVAVLLLIHAILAITSIRNKSVTFDEILHITGGYSYWLTNDFRLHPENGNLPQRWVALPLLLSNVEFPSRDQPAWWGSGKGLISSQFFHDMGNDVENILWRSRAMVVVFSILLGWLIYLWSRHLFGIAGGLLSVSLYSVSPTMLAHARLATSDMTASLGFLASATCLWIVMHRVNRRTVITSGIVLGLLIVSKMSAIIIGPVLIALLVVREWIARPLLYEQNGNRKWIVDRHERILVWGRVFAIQLGIALIVVWTFYGFQFRTFNDFHPDRDRMHKDYSVQGIEQEGLVGITVAIADKLRLIPEGYLRGLSLVLRRAKVRRAFLNGEHSRVGWRHFFPYCLLVKTPLPVFLLVTAGIGTIVWRSCGSTGWRLGRRVLYDGAPLWIFFFVYWILAIQTNLNIGHRHLLPTYPILFIIAGGSVCVIQRLRFFFAVPLLALVLWTAAASTTIWPNYLAYFNPIAGGPEEGYRHLVDSSLDWGQDLPALRDWLDQERLANQESTPVYVSYFGTADINYYKIDSHQLPSYAVWNNRSYTPLTGGIYCISATMLQSIYSPAQGPWCMPYENQYQKLLNNESLFARFENDKTFREAVETEVLDSNEKKKQYQQFIKQRDQFLEFRFARLCAFLRQRQPDDHIGHSILIYRLTDEQVEQALQGEAAELELDVQVKR